MFESVTQTNPGRKGRRWVGFVLGSSLVNAALIVGAYFLVPRDPVAADATEVPISFAPKAQEAAVVEEAPPPPPPPPPPVQVASSDGGRRLRRALEAPSVLPDAPPSAADPVRPPGSDVVTGGTGHGAPGPAAAPVAPEAPVAPVAAPSARKVVQVNEDLEPPVPDPANRMPEYPEAARVAGREGLVEVRIAVSEEGATSIVGVQRGDAPFVEPVLASVSGWRFRPARLDGVAVAVHRVVRVPFRLQR